MAETGDSCAYCGEPTLTGEERPEHPIPAALGASLTVNTVCDPCNLWAGREVDQPFLADDWVREHRSASGIVDPRRGRKARPVRSLLLQGITDDGDFVSLDDDGVPRLQPRIVELGDGKFEIRANTEEEMRRLQRRIERRAEAQAKTAHLESVTRLSSRPRICGRIEVSPVAWLRMAAKIALGVGSLAFAEAWRTGPDAALLRGYMKDEGSSATADVAPGLLPRQVSGTPFERLVAGVEHLLFFRRHEKQSHLVIILFGSALLSVPVGNSDPAVPRAAWKLDPSRPRANGATSLDALLAEATRRFVAAGENQGAEYHRARPPLTSSD